MNLYLISMDDEIVVFVKLFFVVITFIYITEAHASENVDLFLFRHRYATEPKKNPKDVIKESGKLSCMTRNLPRKMDDFKRFTVYSKNERFIMKRGEL